MRTSAKPKADSVPLYQRRKLLRAFRKQYGLTLVELGKVAGLSQPMLSQFERGDRDLSPDAWARVVAATEKLLAEHDAKRKAEVAQAEQTAAKLGAISTPLANLAALARLFGAEWKPSKQDLSAMYSQAFAGYPGGLSRLEALAKALSDEKTERERQLMDLEKLRSQGIDAPIISEVIESFRREIAEKDVRIKELESGVQARQTTDADD